MGMFLSSPEMLNLPYFDSCCPSVSIQRLLSLIPKKLTQRGSSEMINKKGRGAQRDGDEMEMKRDYPGQVVLVCCRGMSHW